VGGLDFSLELPFNLIQVLRLAHALIEAGGTLHVSPKEARKLSMLREIFDLRYEIGGNDVPTLGGLSIDHAKPEVRVGTIIRPLIFPLAALQYCRTRWPASRPVRASFPGLPTPNRRQAIDTWLKLSNLRLRMPENPGERFAGNHLLRHFFRKLTRRPGVPDRQNIYSEGVRLLLSDDGRLFPKKAWNVDYYSCLLESEFVLCPDGDPSVWTYRFFESVLCGAIPVVQHSCSAYDGFKFRHMSERLDALIWLVEDAEHNFNLAAKTLTVPQDELRAEIVRLLDAAKLASPGALAPSVRTA
jgi:hypothetical protein